MFAVTFVGEALLDEFRIWPRIRTTVVGGESSAFSDHLVVILSNFLNEPLMLMRPFLCLSPAHFPIMEVKPSHVSHVHQGSLSKL